MAKSGLSMQSEAGNTIAAIAIFAAGTLSVTGLLTWHPWEMNPYRSSRVLANDRSASTLAAGDTVMSAGTVIPLVSPAPSVAATTPADTVTTSVLTTPTSDSASSVDSAAALSLKTSEGSANESAGNADAGNANTASSSTLTTR